MKCSPETALTIYGENVKESDIAAPIVTLFGYETITPVLLAVPFNEASVPSLLAAIKSPMPLDQVLFNAEATVMTREGALSDAVVIFSAGATEFRLAAPFMRVGSDVAWATPEVQVGRQLNRDPIILALRDLVQRSH